MTRILLAGFLVLHGLIHASYLSPRPAPAPGAPAWPFELGRSWLLSPLGVPEHAIRILGMALVAVGVIAFVLAALATLAVGLPASAWQPLVVVGAIASLALLGLYFHPWLVLGIAIDVVLVIAVWQADWAPDALR